MSPYLAHGRDELRAFRRIQGGQEAVNGSRLQFVEFRECLLTDRGEPDNLTTTVGRRLLPGDEPGGAEVRQDATEVSGIEIEFATQVGNRDTLAVRQLEQHPGLGEPKRRRRRGQASATPGPACRSG